MKNGDKAVTLFGLIVLTIAILPLLAGLASAQDIIIDTEKGVPGFRTEPARDLPANWQYVQDHPDTSADGWFDTNAYPPGQGNGSFWYTISFPDMGECKGIWGTSVPYKGKYEVFAWIPSPDSFDPYLDESTPPSDYLPTKRAQYKIFHNGGVATVTIDQNVNMGGFTSLGVFVFDTTARVELSSNGVEFWRCVAFDVVTFVPVVNDMAVTDVSIILPLTSVGQSTAICVTVTNEGSQQEDNVSVKAFVDGAQVGSTQYVSLDPGSSDAMTFLWTPRAAKGYSVRGEVGVVGEETDTGDNTETMEVRVPPIAIPINIRPPIFDGTRGDQRKSAQMADSDAYTFVTMWPELPQPWYFSPIGIAVDSSGNVYVADTYNCRIQKFDSDGNFITKWGSPGTGDSEFDAPVGIAVDSSGTVYVADTYNCRIQKFDSDGNFITKWGSPGTGDGQFDLPYGIAVDSSGNVYVADTENNRIQKFDSDGNFITKWGSPGTGDSEFDAPVGIAVDSSGNAYVVDSGNNRIQKFDSYGNFITKWGSRGGGDGEFGWPEGIAVDSSGTVYVADLLIDRIQKFDSYGNFITKWSSSGTGDGEFHYPRGIAVDSSGYVYVADTLNDRILKFDSDGNFITKWGSEGTGDGEFNGPCGIAVDSSGYVYVADSGNSRIQKFDSYGNFITKWGSSGTGDGEFHYPYGIAVDTSGHVFVADTYNYRIQKFDSGGNFITKWGSYGNGDCEFNEPYGIAVDTSGYVYVADAHSDRIQKFDSDGNFITKWGSSGTGDGQFDYPSDIAVDTSGYVYVTDTFNDRIQKFDSDGNFITKWGSSGAGDGEFYWPEGIAVDSSGYVYVADTYNHRIQKFAPSIPAHSPIANAGGPYYGNVNEDIQFFGDGTPAKGRTIVTYEWSFDGDTVTEQNPTHTYSEAGTYIATLRVQDSAGLWSKPKVGMVFISDSLIAKYAPVVYLHKDEKSYPTEIKALLTYSDLKTKDETIVGPITVDQLMAHNDEDTYLDLILINSAGILSRNAPDPNYFTLYPINIYARKKTEIGRTALQYWFFYTYNQGKVNAHEGDWEMFQILLDSDENPDRVTYSWHVPRPPFVYGGKTYEWSEVEKVDNTHPKVYVNKGSHANNKEPKLLQSFQIGTVIFPKQDTLTVIDDQTQWVNWKGKWGQQVVPGFSGGVGPKYGSIKYEIADKIFTIYKWQAPALWALICSDGHYEIIPDSPVNIHIYDKDNNHVGINENGTFDCEIPGVYYIDIWKGSLHSLPKRLNT